MDIEKIKEIAEQMPESPEKQKALQAYSNLKTFEVVANVNDFGRNSFITHTTGLVERIEKMSKISILEIAEGSKINFENVVKMNPALGKHPIFLIAKEQLEEVIKRLEEEDD